MKRNPNFNQLSTNYLFPEIKLRVNQFLGQNPSASLISLGVGDTSLPLPTSVTQTLATASMNLGTIEGYSGYGPEQGEKKLREKIAAVIYQNQVQANEVFVSDGAKCDLGRLQMLFGSQVSIAVQDPAYPVYVEGSLIQGVQKIAYLPCHPENHFFPDLNNTPPVDLIYFCSPNNPTGTVATHDQLKRLVDFALAHQSIIIFDSAYANYIQDPSLPKSIYEIKGAKKVAIEVGSFSKLAGFTGVRLGWTVVPKELSYENGQSVHTDWNRLTSTIFNGASNIAQQGGYAVLEDQGFTAVSLTTAFYLENAHLLKNALQALGYEVFGGENAPYLWIRVKEKKSWDIFQYFLEDFHLITTPGSGFGKEGEGFVRLSAFNSRKNTLEAISRLIPFPKNKYINSRI